MKTTILGGVLAATLLISGAAFAEQDILPTGKTGLWGIPSDPPVAKPFNVNEWNKGWSASPDNPANVTVTPATGAESGRWQTGYIDMDPDPMKRHIPFGGLRNDPRAPFLNFGESETWQTMYRVKPAALPGGCDLFGLMLPLDSIAVTPPPNPYLYASYAFPGDGVGSGGGFAFNNMDMLPMRR